jgi:integrase
MTIEAAYSKDGKLTTFRIHSCLIESLRAAMEKSPNEWVFPGPKGTPMHDIRTSFENACEKAGITEKVTPHTLRHTFASNLAMGGVSDRKLQELGRWADAKMLKRYAHLSQENLDEALERIQPSKSLGMILAPLGKTEKLKAS